MANQKKTALELCINDLNCWCCPIIENIKPGKIFCPGRKNGSDYYDREYCDEKIKQYYQEQADIPDGWDVVKEIEAFVRNEFLENTIYEHDEILMHRVMIYVQDKLQQAGIEVNDG